MLTRRLVLGAGLANLAASSSPSWALDGAIDPTGFGAAGNGFSDDTGPLKRALELAFASGRPVDGGRSIFAVSGDLRFEGLSAPWIHSLRLKQLQPANDRKTLHLRNCEGIRIDRLEIDVGRSRRLGYMNESGGLWIDGGHRHSVQNVTVFGHGKNSLIAIWNTRDSSYTNLCARDAEFDDPAVRDDVVQGIFLLYNRNCTIDGAQVRNLTGNAQWSGRMIPNLRTRGIALGGNEDILISNSVIANVDQGIDVTGSPGTLRIKVVGGTATDCGSSGLKFANAAEDCVATRFISRRCGSYGFIISGPNSWGHHHTQRIMLVDCHALDTGGLPVTTAGFMVQAGARAHGPLVRYPRSVRLIRCSALGTDPREPMDYGFYNNVAMPSDRIYANTLTDCRSSGHKIAAQLGAWVHD